MLQKVLGMKVAMLLLLLALLSMPLMMVQGTVSERQSLRDGVVQNIAAASAGRQTITGPILAVPYRETVREQKINAETGGKTVIERVQGGTLYFLPERLAVDSGVETEERYRGIHKALLYRAQAKLTGRFAVPAQFGVTANLADVRFGAAYLVMGIADTRGIRPGLSLDWQGQTLAFQPGTQTGVLRQGVHAPLGTLAAESEIGRAHV